MSAGTGPKRPWTDHELAIVRERYPDTPTATLALELQRSVSSVFQAAQRVGVSKSDAYFASPASGRTNGRQGLATRFPKGHVPANKGLRRPGWHRGRMRETQFKPGERSGVAAQNWCPIGTIRTDAEGYQRIKVREAQHGKEPTGFGNTKVWPLLNRYRWEQAHGPIPPGHSVAFKDRDKTNCALENLELLTRAELMRRNTVHNLPKPLVHTIQLLGALKRQIRRRTSNAEEQDRRPA